MKRLDMSSILGSGLLVANPENREKAVADLMEKAGASCSTSILHLANTISFQSPRRQAKRSWLPRLLLAQRLAGFPTLGQRSR